MCMLSGEQLAEIGRIKIALWKIQDAIERANGLIADTGLPIRQIETFTLALPANDLSQLAYGYQMAMQELQGQAMERMAA